MKKKQVGLLTMAVAVGLSAGIGFQAMKYDGVGFVNTNTEAVSLWSDTNEELDMMSNSLAVQSLASIENTITNDNTFVNDVSGVVEASMPSVVAVNCTTYVSYSSMPFYGWNGYGNGQQTTEQQSSGTGIIIGKSENNLLVLTNYHVVEDVSKVSVTFVENSETEGSVLGYDADADIAVISIPLSSISSETMSEIKIAVLGDSDEVKVGEAAIAIGNALGYGQSVTTGVISALNREVNLVDKTMMLIQTDAAINGGNSGGPLLNASGEVIGINTIKYSYTGVEGMGYAIPITSAKPIIEKILTQKETAKAYLGIYGIDIVEQYQSLYGMPAGVYIHQVIENSPAYQYGLQTEDIIVSVKGTEVASMEEIGNILAASQPNDTIEIQVKRLNGNNYETVTLDVVLGSK